MSGSEIRDFVVEAMARHKESHGRGFNTLSFSLQAYREVVREHLALSVDTDGRIGDSFMGYPFEVNMEQKERVILYWVELTPREGIYYEVDKYA